MLRETDTSILVADAGLKPVIPTATSDMTIAEPAAIYRVDLAAGTVIRVSERGRLVFPSGLAGDTSELFVSDLGEYADVGWAGTVERVWRANASEFGVSVHFSSARTPGADRDRIVGDIVALVSREKPAHTHWTLVYRRL